MDNRAAPTYAGALWVNGSTTRQHMVSRDTIRRISLVKHYKCQQWCSTKATVYLIKSGVYDVMFCFVLKVKNSYAYVLTFYIKNAFHTTIYTI